MPHLSLTTWSLHRELGPLKWTYWDENEKTHKTLIEQQPENTTLLELPSILAKQHFQSMEVCHFHFPSTEKDYLLKLKHSFETVGMNFHCLLVDYGDISSSDENRRKADIEYMKNWIDIASIVGAKSIRVIAGEAPPTDKQALKRSKESLKELVAYALQKQVRVVTENFKPLSSTKENCIELLSDNELGLTVDFGNFNKDVKYDSIKNLMPYAESIHAKANYDENGAIDEEEFRHSLNIVAEHHYNGPITLVYDGPGNLWDGIQRVKSVAKEYCN